MKTETQPPAPVVEVPTGFSPVRAYSFGQFGMRDVTTGGRFIVSRYRGQFHTSKYQTRAELGLWYARATGTGCKLEGEGETPTKALADLRARAQSLREELARVYEVQDPKPAPRPFACIAWTGGDRPAKPSRTSKPETAYRRALFREQVNTWRNAWKDSPEWDTLRIFWGRAYFDSFATFRSASNF